MFWALVVLYELQLDNKATYTTYNADTFTSMCCVYLTSTIPIVDVVVVSHVPSFDVLECLTSFLELVVAGIAGSPHMISATIISVSRVVYEFRSEYSTGINNIFCETFCLKCFGVV